MYVLLFIPLYLRPWTLTEQYHQHCFSQYDNKICNTESKQKLCSRCHNTCCILSVFLFPDWYFMYNFIHFFIAAGTVISVLPQGLMRLYLTEYYAHIAQLTWLYLIRKRTSELDFLIETVIGGTNSSQQDKVGGYRDIGLVWNRWKFVKIKCCPFARPIYLSRDKYDEII